MCACQHLGGKLDRQGIHRRVSRRKPQLKDKTRVVLQVHSPRQMRILWYELNRQIWRKTNTAIPRKQPPPNSEAWWLKMERVLATFLLLNPESWILSINPRPEFSSHQSGSWRWDRSRCCNKTLAQRFPERNYTVLKNYEEMTSENEDLCSGLVQYKSRWITTETL